MWMRCSPSLGTSMSEAKTDEERKLAAQRLATREVEDGWARALREQRSAWRKLSAEQKLRWLEEAKAFCREALGTACTCGRRARRGFPPGRGV